MTQTLAATMAERGYVSPVRVLDEAGAAEHREALEAAEAQLGPLHYRDKVHTVLSSAYELCTHPTVLDAVEHFIGPDILLYNSTYIIKEPGAASHVSWHQDLTYWGLVDDDAQVSMWLALAPATLESGCMEMLPGSHLSGRVEHRPTDDADNVLLLGQQIDEVDTSTAVPATLEPGEASFHHGWTIHASRPNVSDDRRIGLNVQFLAPHNRSRSETPQSAMLVRGTDPHGFYAVDDAPSANLAPDAIARWEALDAAMKQGFQTQ